MLPKSNRLSKSAEVKSVLQKGKPYFSPYFIAKHRGLGTESNGFKFTVVVSTKVSKRAVQRNRIKRIIREQIRLNIGALRSGSYVFTVKPKILEIYDDKIAEQFLIFLKQTKILQ